jgi:hypothetical protein
MSIDYANQIANLITQHIPISNIDSIGDSFDAISVSYSTGKITLDLSASDYTIISNIVNDLNSPNSIFTVNGFQLKNNIEKFEAYPDDSSLFYGFTVRFARPHKYKKGGIVDLKNFTDVQYNDQYKVLKINSPFEAVLHPINPAISFVTQTSGLGFTPVEYTEGLNGLKTIVDEGGDQISFVFDENQSFTVTSINEIDLDFLPKVYYYVDSVKVINLRTFLQNLTSAANKEYLIIDTASLSTSPIRSTSNTSDASYNSYSRSGYFDTNNSITIAYLLERNINDVDNQTESGSDIVDKQMKMFESLTSILRQPLDSGLEKYLSSMTISNSVVDQETSEGAIIINYEIEFTSSYQEPILLDLDVKNSYPIDSVKFNENTFDNTIN